jgi:hypothetical protein
MVTLYSAIIARLVAIKVSCRAGCMQSLPVACNLCRLHAICTGCMQSVPVACTLCRLHAICAGCMQSVLGACNLSRLHAICSGCIQSVPVASNLCRIEHFLYKPTVHVGTVPLGYACFYEVLLCRTASARSVPKMHLSLHAAHAALRTANFKSSPKVVKLLS